jgi:flagellar motor component MotA
MENVAVSLIVDGKFKNVVMPKGFISPLANKLREEGKYAVHFAEETVMAEGILILAKGVKHQFMIFPNED